MPGVLAGAVVTVLLFGAAPASASHVDCGDTITVDTVLDSDLVDCPNLGLVVGADRVTLDLNGHRIDGDGTPFAGCGPKELCDAGILSEGNSGLKVVGGVVREFAFGAFSAGGNHIRFLRLRAKHNELFGMILVDVFASKIRKSRGARNPSPDGDGLGIFASRGVRVLNSVFRLNALGLHVEDSTRIELRGNLFRENEGPGILFQANRNEVRHNRCVENDGPCVLVASGQANVIARNRVLGGGGGIGVEAGSENRVSRNRVRDVERNGIYLGLARPAIGGDHNLLRNNLVRESGGDAIVVRPEARHSVLRGNSARRADEDGIDVASGSTALANNLATRNGDLGIEAGSGVIDRGGNGARRNGDPRQCIRVSCG